MKNVCIVGYGAIGAVHAASLTKVKNASLYAVCDKNPDRLCKCASKYNVIKYLNFEEMLKDKNIDSVHICTPHFLHYDMLQKALFHDKKIVVEKPVVMTKNEFDSLLIQEKSSKIAVILQNRYNSCIIKLKKILEENRLGEIKAVKGIVTWHRTKDYYQNDDWRGKWATEGGSALINQAVHTLDLMIYLVGNIKSVRANMQNYTLNDVIETEDTVNAYMCFEKGIKGIFYATNAYGADTDSEIEIIGTNATARYMYKKLMINGEMVAEDTVAYGGKSYWGNGHEALIADYYENDRYFSPHDIKNTMNTLFGMYESARSNGREIIVI